MPDDIAAIAKGLSAEQCALIQEANAWFEQKLLVSAKDTQKLKMWETGLTELHNFSCDRLTPLGQQVRAHLQKGTGDA